MFRQLETRFRPIAGVPNARRGWDTRFHHHSRGRLRPGKRYLHRSVAAAGFAFLMSAAGCAPSLRGSLAPSDQAALRAQAIDFLKRAAVSDEPILRMQAIEAFQEVAPGEGRLYIVRNIDNGYAGVSFAALMAAGVSGQRAAEDRVRLRAEDADASVRIAAIFALHKLGDRRRTGELGELLLNHPDARVRGNAALAIGRLRDHRSVRLLHMALHKERKDAVKMQILEALALADDSHGIDRLRFYGYSAVPDQAALALMLLANAGTPEAEDLFRYRLHYADHPEIRLQAARGLGRLGYDAGLDLALEYLFWDDPDRRRTNDPPEQQIIRVRALAGLALEAIGDPDSLEALGRAFHDPEQPDLVRVALARAIVHIVDRVAGGRVPQGVLGRTLTHSSPSPRPGGASPGTPAGPRGIPHS